MPVCQALWQRWEPRRHEAGFAQRTYRRAGAPALAFRLASMLLRRFSKRNIDPWSQDHHVLVRRKPAGVADELNIRHERDELRQVDFVIDFGRQFRVVLIARGRRVGEMYD